MKESEKIQWHLKRDQVRKLRGLWKEYFALRKSQRLERTEKRARRMDDLWDGIVDMTRVAITSVETLNAFKRIDGEYWDAKGTPRYQAAVRALKAFNRRVPAYFYTVPYTDGPYLSTGICDVAWGIAWSEFTAMTLADNDHAIKLSDEWQARMGADSRRQ